MKKKILISLVIAAFGVGTFIFGNYTAATNYQVVATTDNPQKANEIQETLTKFDRPTIRYVDGSKYMIAIFGTNKKKIDYAAVELVENGIITDDVELNLNVNFSKLYKCPPELKNNIDKALENRLKHIEGIYSAKTNIDIPNLMFEFDKTPEAEVTVLTNKAFDLERISNNVKTLLAASIPGLTEENVKINFEFEDCNNKCQAKTYYGQAKRAMFMDRDYEKAIKNLKKAEELEPQTYTNSIKYLKKLNELNNKIANNPNDYRLYIERGDIQNIEEYSMFALNSSITSNYQAAIDDYNKALELNPKVYEVYEKLGDAYSNIGCEDVMFVSLKETLTMITEQ